MDVTNAVSIRLLASRSLNQLRCWLSYALSLFGVVRVRHLPTFVSVEPANFCQLRCPECPVGMRAESRRVHPADRSDDGATTPGYGSHADGSRVGVMPMDIFQRILSEVQSTAHTMQFYFQGEPLLNKQLPKMIALAHDAGLYTIVSTNAQAITPVMAEALIKSGLSRIIVSIDGFSEDSYAAYRVGGSLHKALEGLQLLRQAKDHLGSRIVIELQVLRLKTNEHEWQWIQKNYKSLGATRLVFKTAQLYNFENGHPLMPTDERYSRYRKTADGTYVHKKKEILNSKFKIQNSPCFRLWSGCVITTNGDVLPCCYDKEQKYILGNITSSTLSDLFHSSSVSLLRKRILSGKTLPLMCRNCNQ